MTNTKYKIKIIIGSTRPERFSEKPAKWIFEEVSKLENVDTELLDLRDYPLPFYNEPQTMSSHKGQYASPVVDKWHNKIGEADAFIIVTPEYNHGYPAVLKNALDYAYNEWNRKPVGFVSYGGVAGARSVEQLRQVVIELQMAPIRIGLHIAEFWKKTDDEGNFIPEGLEEKKVDFLKQLIWWTKALKDAREGEK